MHEKIEYACRGRRDLGIILKTESHPARRVESLIAHELVARVVA